jgi:hypothetical protein
LKFEYDLVEERHSWQWVESMIDNRLILLDFKATNLTKDLAVDRLLFNADYLF